MFIFLFILAAVIAILFGFNTPLIIMAWVFLGVVVLGVVFFLTAIGLGFYVNRKG